jgi:SH3-like domain-containing protein
MTCSKAGHAGQARRLSASGLALAAVGVASLALAGCGGRAGEGTNCPPWARGKSVSGFCVPRYVSLKRDEVFARKGPGKDYPALWVYRVQGLPVQIVAETQEWRRICDPDGGAAWVNRSMVDGRRTVMAVGKDQAPMLKAPKSEAPVAGFLEARAIAVLGRCSGAFCKVKVGGVSGWVDGSRLWGLAEARQCR